jgi:hypothetical protein
VKARTEKKADAQKRQVQGTLSWMWLKVLTT